MSAIQNVRAAEAALIHTIDAGAAALRCVGANDLAAALKRLDEERSAALARLQAAAAQLRAAFADMAGDAEKLAADLMLDLEGAPEALPAPEVKHLEAPKPEAPTDAEREQTLAALEETFTQAPEATAEWGAIHASQVEEAREAALKADRMAAEGIVATQPEPPAPEAPVREDAANRAQHPPRQGTRPRRKGAAA